MCGEADMRVIIRVARGFGGRGCAAPAVCFAGMTSAINSHSNAQRVGARKEQGMDRGQALGAAVGVAMEMAVEVGLYISNQRHEWRGDAVKTRPPYPPLRLA